jgi:uncharacterized damage-inducible protein DinB
MTYYGAKEIAASFRTVRANTIVIAGEIGEEHYGFSATPDTRTIAQLLTHVALSTRMYLQIHKVEHLYKLEGFDFMGFFGKLMAEEQTPRNKEQIAALLREEGEAYAGWVETVSDDFLAESVTLPPGMTPPCKTRFEMLLSPKEHEMHHRGQLMQMERMIGIVPHLTRAMQARIAQMQAAAKASA